MTNTNLDTNDFQSLFRAIKFRELLEKGMSTRLDLTEKTGKDLPLGKMTLTSDLHGLKTLVETGEDRACNEVSSQDRYRLVVEIESFQSLENKGYRVEKGYFEHGLDIFMKIELID